MSAAINAVSAGMPPRKSWFARNALWLIPAIILAALLLLAAFIAGVFAIVFGSMKSSEPYQHAVAVVTSDPRAVQALGRPVQPKWYVSGSFNISNSSGDANLAIPVRGSIHSGTITVVAKKKNGIWSYETMELQVEDGSQKIDFLSTGEGKTGRW
ncbi:MAG: cytochrome c oxidase assembly factor 1 family protein [Acidobacteriia bacterium]|nr:cytochrome c oxidase assembly factor 1 family protein [Terriglobia bacterium]